jgi:RNA polymerase sigma-70 factor (ECF subfamily)
MDQRDDVKQLKRIGEGDLHALSLLYDRYHSVLYGLALRILASQEHAEELTANLFIELWEGGVEPALQSGDVFSWFLGLCRRRALELRRSKEFQSRVREAEGEESTAEEPASATDAFQADRSRVASLVKQLSRDHLRILKLAYFKGYGPVQIARMLRTSPGSVRARLQDGVAALREKEARPAKGVQEHHQAEQSLGYVLGDLTGSRRQQFEQHLAGRCALCAAEVAAIERAVHLLPLTLPVRLPSAELKQRILARAAESGKARRRAAVGAQQPRAAVRPWMLYTVLAVLAVVIVGGSFLLQSVVGELDAQGEQLARLKEQQQHATAALAMLQRPGVQSIALTGEGSLQGSVGYLLLDPASGECVLVCTEGPPVGADSAYHIWLADRGTELHVGEATGVSLSGVMVQSAVWSAPRVISSGEILVTLEPRGAASRGGTVWLRGSVRTR